MASDIGDSAIGDVANRPLDDPAVLAAARGMLKTPTAGYDRPTLLGQELTEEKVAAPLALKTRGRTRRQPPTQEGERTVDDLPVTFRTYPTGHIATVQAALPDSHSFVRNLFQPLTSPFPARDPDCGGIERRD
ncbi:hypothetical protein M2405_004795 [Rhodococcus erythropolis]|uniref:hypothetical protein n=1 Tax=Rhodococcus erythropolis group TaxID=2840174 RepID=UPI002166F2B7|nr:MULTISPECIES: hypothetical protein [Rhodococcus erythropolis group]MCS4256484.1 hypothetical protein [Rhodococcus erythropolis]MCW2430825.1 hypothetical protein [Rhodococcus erythropolis]MEA1798999.1 hypothetical protein [Rhodococcus qingshengii]